MSRERSFPGKCFLSGFMLLFIAVSTPQALDVEEAGELAVSSSFELRAASRLLSLRSSSWRLSLRSYFPTLTLDSGEDDHLEQGGPDSFRKTWALSISQLLWDGGALSTRYKLEEASIALERRSLEREETELRERAYRAYRSVLSARFTVQIRAESRESLAEQLRILRVEEASGHASRQELAEAELSEEEAALEVSLAEIENEEAEKELAALLGLESLPPLSATFDLDRAECALDGQTITSLALGANPEIESARYSVRKQKASLSLARSAWYPSIYLEGGVELGGEQYPLTQVAWKAALRITFATPLFSATTRASYRETPPLSKDAAAGTSVSLLDDPSALLSIPRSKAELELEEERLSILLSSLPEKVEKALSRYHLGAKKLSLTRRKLETAQARLELGQVHLRLGRITRIELMEEALEVSSRKLEAGQAVGELLSLERELERLADLPPGALGGLSRERSGGTDGK